MPNIWASFVGEVNWDTGHGGDTVIVLATTGPLNINGTGGQDPVNLGNMSSGCKVI